MAETLLQKAQRLGIRPAEKMPEKSVLERVLGAEESVAGALGFGGATDVIGSNIARATVPEAQRGFIRKPTTLENIGAGIQVGSTLIPAGAGANLLKNIVLGATTGDLYDVGEDLVAGEGKEALIPGIGTAIGAVVPPVLRGAGKALGSVFGSGKKVVTKTAEVVSGAIPEKAPEVISGAVQKGTEVLERVPRFIGRIKEGAEQAAQRAERIELGTPSVQKAIKSELDERIINTVQQADEPTLNAYKEIVDIAENPSKTLKPKQRPEIVAGKAAGEQYGLIEKQRRTIGAKIGEAVNKLSKSVVVPMQNSFGQLDNVLMENGITPIRGKLNFQGRFTPAERTRV